MKKLKFFITGGMGYIGSQFAKQALKKNHDVCLYDSLIYEQNVNRMVKEITADHKSGSVQLIIGDTRNKALLKESLLKFAPTHVLHFAELSSVYACNHNPIYTESVNFHGSKQVIDICEELNLKVIYNSTSSVYGTQKKIKLMDEHDKLPKTTDYYCYFKLKMEAYIKNKVKQNQNFRIIMFRPATVFGLSPRFRIELLPNHFTYLAVSKKQINISELNAYRAAIDIEELIKAYFKVVETSEWKHLIYNVGHYNLSKKEFALGVQQVIKCKIGQAPDIGDLRNLQINCERFNQEFDFHPTKPFSESIRDISNWLRKNLTVIENNNFAELLNMPLNKWQQICS